MPNKDYISKIYSALADNLEGFDKTPEQFEVAMKDSNYAKKAFVALKENLADFDKDESQFMGAVYGANEIKKKEQPTPSTFGGSVSPTQDTRMGASVSPLQPEGQQEVNSLFNTVSFRGGVNKNKPVEKDPRYSQITNSDRKKSALKVLKNTALGIGIDTKEAEKVLDRAVQESPSKFDELAVVYKQKEADNKILNDSDIKSIVNYSNEHLQKVKGNKADFADFQQSKLGKVNDIINSVFNGERISPEDEEYIKNNAAKSYNELMGSVPQYSEDYPIQNLNTVSEILGKRNKQNQIIKSNQDVLNTVELLSAVPDFDSKKLGTEHIDEEISKIQTQYDLKSKELEAKYPIQTYQARTADGYDTRVQPRSKEYLEEKRKLQEQHNDLNSKIAKANAYKYATSYPTIATSESVGEQAYKVMDPTRFNNYVKGGRADRTIKADINKLGFNILQSTGNVELISKGVKDEQEFDRNFPEGLQDETARRLAMEYVKQNGGVNTVKNITSLNVNDADKLAEQLPDKYKQVYLTQLRPSAVEKSTKSDFGPYSLGLTDYLGIKKDAVIDIPSMGGIFNALGNGYLQPIEGVVSAIVFRGESEKEGANRAIKKQWVGDEKLIDRDVVNNSISEIENKKNPTAQDINALNDLKDQLTYKTRTNVFLDGTFGLAGQVISQAVMTELGTPLISGTAKVVGIGSRAIELAEGAEQVALQIANIKKAKNVSGSLVAYLSSYDDADKEAQNLGLDGWKQWTYSNVVAGLNAGTERIFKDEKIFDAFRREVSPLVATMVSNINTSSITEAALSAEIKTIITKTLPKYAKNIAIENQKEAVEEVATQVGTSIAKGLLATDKFNGDEEIKAVKQVWWETSIYGGLTSGMAGIGETRRSTISKKALYDLGKSDANVNQFIDVVNAQVAQGNMSQGEADKKIQIAKTVREISSKSIPIIKSKKELNEREEIKLTSLLLAERQLNQDISNPELSDIKDVNKKELAVVQKLKNDIIDGNVVVDSDLNVYTPEEWKAKQTATTGTTSISEKAKKGSGIDLFDEIQKKNAEVGSGSEATGSVDATAETAPIKDEITVGEMVDKVGTYKGERGRFYQDGQSVIFKVDGQNKEYELGNIDDVKNTSISSFSIGNEESVVNLNDLGNVVVRGEEYVNNYSDPTQAINRDKDGNVVSVNLETPDGKKRTFRGNISEDIAYQIHLKEITKDDGTKSEFEQFINEGEVSKEMDNGGLSETPKATTVENNEAVSREKIEPKTVSEFVDKISKGEQMTTPEELQFYENNKSEIEKALGEKVKSESTPTDSKVEAGSVGVGGDEKSNFNFEPKTNEELGTPEVVVKDNNGNTIGNITTSLDPKDKNSLVVQSIDVKPGNQNKGVGKQLYLELAKNNPDKTIKSSPRLAGEYAIKAWESLVRDGIAEKVGENKYEIKPQSAIKKVESKPTNKPSENNIVELLDYLSEKFSTSIEVDVKNVDVKLMASQTPLEKASSAFQSAKKAYDSKKKELYGNVVDDALDLFGERRAVSNTLFGNSMEQVDSERIQSILAPFKARMDNARTALEKANRDSQSQGSLFQYSSSSIQTITKEAFNRLVGKLSKAFPNVNVFYDNDLMKAKLLKDGYPQNLIDNTGDIYGVRFSDGSIYLNQEKMNANSPIHEFSHIWESMNPKKWNEGISLLKGTVDGKNIFKQIKSEPAYSNLTDEQIWSEALNTLIGYKGEGKFNNPSVLKRFKQWIVDFFKSIGDKLGIKNLTSDEKLQDFTSKVLGDLLGGKPLVNDYLSDNQSTSFMILGEKGVERLKNAESILKNLSIAKQMEIEGKDEKTIRLATGWERGAESKWRFEIPDAVLTGTAKKDTDNGNPSNFVSKLNSVIKSKELFDAYPSLKDVNIKFTPQIGEYPSGLYSSDTNTITINSTADNKLWVVLHELQHVIQKIEGFTQGTNPGATSLKSITIRDEINLYNSNEEYRDLYKKSESNTLTEEEESRMREIYRAEVNRLNTLSGYEMYRRNAGEVEARNVQTRMDLSKKQRAERTLSETEDIARDQQIYFRRAMGVQASISESQFMAISNDDIKSQFPELSDERIEQVKKIVGAKKTKYELSELLGKLVSSNQLDQQEADQVLSLYDALTEPTPKPKKEKSTSDDMTGIAIRHTDVIKEAFGLPKYEPSPKTDEEINAEADAEIAKGVKVWDILSRWREFKFDPETIQVETELVKRYIGAMESMKSLSNEQIDQYQTAVEISEMVGRLFGKGLQGRVGDILKQDSLAGFLAFEKQNAKVDELTEGQIANVTKEFNDIKEAKEKLEAKVIELEKKISRKVAEQKIRSEKSTSRTRKIDDIKKERQSIFDSIREKLKNSRSQFNSTPLPYANELIAISPDVAKLVKSYVEEGIVNLSEIVDGIYDIIKDSSSNITKDDIVDVIAGKYNDQEKTKNQVKSELIDLKKQAELISQLNDLENGIVPTIESKKIKRNQEISKLRKQINENDLYQLAKAKATITNKIAKLEEDLATGNFQKPTSTEPVIQDMEYIVLKDEYIRLKKERAIRLLQEEYANRSKTQIAKDKALEVLNLPRTLMSSMDFSAPLRQGLVASVAHPVIASKAFVEMFRQSVSQKRFDRWFSDVRESALYPLIDQSGLFIADPHNIKLQFKEEQFMNNLAERIPFIGGAIKFTGDVKIPFTKKVIGNLGDKGWAIPFTNKRVKEFGGLVKGSERAYVSYLNKMRFDLFAQGVDVLYSKGLTFENNKEEFIALAGFINNATGRGKLGTVMGVDLEKGAPIFNAALFSPRLIASRLTLLNPVYYAKLPKNVRMMAIDDMLKFAEFSASMLTLLALSFGCEDDCEDCEGCVTVETDPRSTDFGKLKVGDTRYDILGGFAQYMRLIAVMTLGQTKSTTKGEIKEIDGKGLFGEDRTDVLTRFVRGKLAPLPSAAVNLAKGTNIIGQPATLQGEFKKIMLPLIYHDVEEALKKDSYKALLTTGLPAAFGIGVTTYSAKEKGSKNGIYPK